MPKEKVRPDSRRFTDAERGKPHLRIDGGAGLTRDILYFHDGKIDGGDLNGCSPAMDYLDTDIDGGTF